MGDLKKWVVDAPVLLRSVSVERRVYTTPQVIKEVKDPEEKVLVEQEVKRGRIIVVEPEEKFLRRVKEVARKMGEYDLTPADLSVLALALQLGAVLITDDYEIQNVAAVLGLKFKSFEKKGIREIIFWKYRCQACGFESETPGECPVCGERLKKIPKRVIPLRNFQNRYASPHNG